MFDNKCTRCGSTDLIPDLNIVDHGYYDTKHDLAIEMANKPDAFFFKDTRKGTLKATVCGQCGKVELSVDNPQELWDIYRRTGKT
ncbi:MAG: hypothetical protein AAGF31_04660 [Planctomycetota bacterium]